MESQPQNPEFRNILKTFPMHSKKLQMTLKIAFNGRNTTLYNHIFEPAPYILVLIAYASSQDSDKSAHLCSLAGAFAAHVHKVWNKIITQPKI